MASIFDELKAKKLFPAYLLYGPEFYLKERAKDQIIKLALEGAERSLNYDHLSGAEQNAAKDAVTLARSIPFAANRRVVLLAEVEKAWNYTDRAQIEGKNFLLDYLTAPTPTTVLIMTDEQAWSTKEPPKELVAATTKIGRVQKFELPTGAELKKWVKTLAYENDKDIDEDAISLLAQLVGSDLLAMSQEIQKASLYAANRGVITADDVLATGIKYKVESIFTLIDFVASKNAPKAIKLLEEIFSYADEFQILALIARQMRILVRAKKLAQNGYTLERIVQSLRLPRFLAPRLKYQMEQFNLNQLEQAIVYCSNTDRALKSTPVPSSLLLERLILEICLMEQK